MREAPPRSAFWLTGILPHPLTSGGCDLGMQANLFREALGKGDTARSDGVLAEKTMAATRGSITLAGEAFGVRENALP